MKLYYSRGTCSLAPHILLHEMGAQFELEAVDYTTKDTPNGMNYLDVNPMGYVPALALDSGEVLTEAAIILQYLADRKPEARLVGEHGSMERYHTLKWTHFVSSEIHKYFTSLHFSGAEYKEIVRNKLIQRLKHIDDVLSRGEYLTGSQYTIADIYLFTATTWMPSAELDMASFPNLEQLSRRVGARPAVQAAMKSEGLLK